MKGEVAKCQSRASNPGSVQTVKKIESDLDGKNAAHQIKKRLQSVEIEIDRHSLLPIRVAYAEPDGDSTEYSFSAIEMNKPQSAGLFDLALPPDVHIVQLKLGSGE